MRARNCRSVSQMSKTAKKIKSLDDIKAREHNPNQGTERGRVLTRASLEEFGAGRSIVVDRNGELIGGHTTTEQFRAIAKPEDIIVVPSDGTKLVVVQRTDLESGDRKAQMLAHVDNLTAHHGYNPDNQIVADIADDLFDAGFLEQDEFDALFVSDEEDAANVNSSQTQTQETQNQNNSPSTENADTSSQLGTLTYRIVLDCVDETHQAGLLARFEKEGLACRPLIS